MPYDNESAEDRIVSALIDRHPWRSERGPSMSEEDTHWAEFEPEAHYNYYGDRGVVDLFIREFEAVEEYGIERVSMENVYEIKSESAVKSATGANEIIRQFKRHCNYFYQDESRKCKVPGKVPHRTHFQLVFEATPDVLTHVENNSDLYCQVTGDTIGGGETPVQGIGRSRHSDVSLQFGAPDINPVTCRIGISNIKQWKDALRKSHIRDEMAERLGIR